MLNIELKRKAAQKALDFVEQGMNLGLGTGSTANEFIKLLAQKIHQGLQVKAVATSYQTELLCKELAIKLHDIDYFEKLDLVVDGVDEIDLNKQAIKGGGGALLREKIVAKASGKVIAIADETKLVTQLGKYPLPLEINKFGAQTSLRACRTLLDELGYNDIKLDFRLNKDGCYFITDGGHYILDAELREIKDAEILSRNLHKIAGLVEHGLFLNIIDLAIIAKTNGDILLL